MAAAAVLVVDDRRFRVVEPRAHAKRAAPVDHGALDVIDHVAQLANLSKICTHSIPDKQTFFELNYPAAATTAPRRFLYRRFSRNPGDRKSTRLNSSH